MQIQEQKIDSVLKYPFDLQYPLESILFFDIETTGLSSNMSYLYLIGCIYFKGKETMLKQWFADSIEDEKQIIIDFFNFLKSYKVLIHYNGSGFDIPYLLAKSKRYQLRNDFTAVTSIDIYKELLPIKKILLLDSLKQRNVERFLRIKREDPFTGGDLINVYAQYVGVKRYETLNSTNFQNPYEVHKESGLPSLKTSPSDALLQVLLLHNTEDLKGLLGITSMLSYVDFFRGNISELEHTYTNDGLYINFTLSSDIPKELIIEKHLNTLVTSEIFNATNYVITCKINHTKGSLYIPFYQGELKHFFVDYKDYYYLPLEDTAIHKSIAEYVEKGYRKKATKETCYLKKSSTFLPQPDKEIAPYFQFNLKDKLFWFENDTEIISSTKEMFLDNIINYAKQIIFLLK